MDSIKYQQVAIGKRISALRMAKGMTQEQLASVLNVSPAAVSKWERNLATPSVELLWALADFFDCSIDELVGRKSAQIEAMGVYDAERLRLAEIGEDLLKCSEISRKEGLLAMEDAVPGLKGKSAFLAFAVPYIMYVFLRKEGVEQAFGFLENYVGTLPEKEQREGHMIEAAAGLGDFEIQTMLRNMDNDTLTAALAGASGKVAVRFLSNLADRILFCIHEDIEHWNGTEQEILAAQRKVLEIGAFCLGDSQISAEN